MAVRRNSVMRASRKPKARTATKTAAAKAAVADEAPVEGLMLDQDLLARARREVPVLREQVAADLAGLRQLAGR